MLPQIAHLVEQKPHIRDHFSLDPSELGFPWRIASAPVSIVLFIEPNHGLETRLETCPKYRMANLIMSESLLPAAGAGDWVRDISAVLENSDCWLLRYGNLDLAIEAIKSLFGRASNAESAGGKDG